jgi:hypothetical protein
MLDNFIDKNLAQELDNKLLLQKCIQDSNYLNRTLKEIDNYINDMQSNNVKALESGGGADEEIDEEQVFCFLRSQERIEQTRVLIQYLFTFLKKLPLDEQIGKEIVNPFEQFKSFIYFSIGLLKEEDVRRAIFEECAKVYTLNGGIKWNYQGLNESNKKFYQERINKIYLILLNNTKSLKRACHSDYQRAFKILANLSLFWFSVKNSKLECVRRSDRYIYILTKLLLHRISKRAGETK